MPWPDGLGEDFTVLRGFRVSVWGVTRNSGVDACLRWFFISSQAIFGVLGSVFVLLGLMGLSRW